MFGSSDKGFAAWRRKGAMQLGFRSVDGKFIRDKIAASVAGPILTRPRNDIMDSATGKIRGTPATVIGYIPMEPANVSALRTPAEELANKKGQPLPHPLWASCPMSKGGTK
jgi:hypothetical protein